MDNLKGRSPSFGTIDRSHTGRTIFQEAGDISHTSRKL